MDFQAIQYDSCTGRESVQGIMAIPVFVVENVSLISVILYQAARDAMRI